MQLNYEPCGLFCGMMTWVCLAYGSYATTVGVILPWLGFSLKGLLHIVFFNITASLALVSHYKGIFM